MVAHDTLFLVRTQGFGTMARLLAERLAATGVPVAAVVDQRDGPVDTAPFDKIDLSERRLAELGFSGLPADWRWLCGDLCYALAADARPDFAAYALIESDVYLPEASAAKLVEALRLHPAEAIAARLGSRHGRRKYSKGLARLGLDPDWGCIFPLTRASATVVWEMGVLRKEQLATAPDARLNDEAILAGAVLRRGLPFERLEALVPELVAAECFDTNPPFLFEALRDNPEERRVFHPVVPFEMIMERLRTGEKSYSKRRLRHVLQSAPDPMAKAIRRVLRDSGTTGRMHRRPDLVRMNGLVAALSPDRRLRIADVGANPLIEGEVSYRRLLDAGHADVVGFEPQEEALAALNARKSAAELYLPHAPGDGTPRTLHLTQSPGFASVFPADPASAALLGFSRGMSVTERAEVATRRLDDCAEVPPIDFLKIDVQGSETAIIAHGAIKLAEAVAIPFGEEGAEQVRGLGLGDAVVDLGRVVALRMGEDAGAVQDAAGFRIARSEIEPGDAGEGNRRGAHRAGFQRDVKRMAGQTFRPGRGAGRAQDKDFGMRGRVGQFARAVAGLRHHPAGGVQHHRAHRHLAARGGGAGLKQRD
jgi:FkbM family methyltransferase